MMERERALAFPMPGTLRMGSVSMKRRMAALSLEMANCPSGLLMSEATFASSLLGPMPQEQVTVTSSRTLRLISAATASPAR